MPKKPLTVTFNRRALLVRLERALKKDGRKIRVDRIGQHTRYLLVDTKQNSLVEVDVDLEELAPLLMSFFASSAEQLGRVFVR